MNILSVESVSKSYGEKILLEHVQNSQGLAATTKNENEI